MYSWSGAARATMGRWQVVTESPTFSKRPSLASWIGRCGELGDGSGHRGLKAHHGGAMPEGSKVQKDERSVLLSCNEYDHLG